MAALGGNAFVAPGQALTMAGQFRYAEEALAHLDPLLGDDVDLVLTHGNGPQVGQMLVRAEEAVGHVEPLTLAACVAETEGNLGYVLAQTLYNLLARRRSRRPLASLLSQVKVSLDDPAFAHPTKPIGLHYDRARADALAAQGFTLREEPGRGWRRVVPSPEPRELLDIGVIGTLLSHGVLVIAAGGGGVPVVERDGALHGVDAVIDKDLTAALLADRVGASLLVILTDVPCAYTGWRTDAQRPVGRVRASEVKGLLAEGHFPPGSMGPKVEAASRFAVAPGRRAIVCTPHNLAEALAGRGGTVVVPDAS